LEKLRDIGINSVEDLAGCKSKDLAKKLGFQRRLFPNG